MSTTGTTEKPFFALSFVFLQLFYQCPHKHRCSNFHLTAFELLVTDFSLTAYLPVTPSTDSHK